MDYFILHVVEPWHHKPHGAMVHRGHEFSDPAEVAKILAERPHSVVKRRATPEEAKAIEARLNAPAEPETGDDADEVSA